MAYLCQYFTTNVHAYATRKPRLSAYADATVDAPDSNIALRRRPPDQASRIRLQTATTVVGPQLVTTH